jgi:hypothetical protein
MLHIMLLDTYSIGGILLWMKEADAAAADFFSAMSSYGL